MKNPSKKKDVDKEPKQLAHKRDESSDFTVSINKIKDRESSVESYESDVDEDANNSLGANEAKAKKKKARDSEDDIYGKNEKSKKIKKDKKEKKDKHKKKKKDKKDKGEKKDKKEKKHKREGENGNVSPKYRVSKNEIDQSSDKRLVSGGEGLTTVVASNGESSS